MGGRAGKMQPGTASCPPIHGQGLAGSRLPPLTPAGSPVAAQSIRRAAWDADGTTKGPLLGPRSGEGEQGGEAAAAAAPEPQPALVILDLEAVAADAHHPLLRLEGHL